MTSLPTDGFARRLTILLSIAFLSMALWLTAAAPTFACSCVQPEPMAAYGTADNAIFAGTAGPSDARGVPVHVATWFHGRDAAPIVYLSAQSFSDSASCGTSVPPVGSAWIWVAFLPEGGGDPMTGLCSPHGQLGTPDGDALLKDATATYRRDRSARFDRGRSARSRPSGHPLGSGRADPRWHCRAWPRAPRRGRAHRSTARPPGCVTLAGESGNHPRSRRRPLIRWVDRGEGHGRATIGGSQRHLPPPARERPGPRAGGSSGVPGRPRGVAHRDRRRCEPRVLAQRRPTQGLVRPT